MKILKKTLAFALIVAAGVQAHAAILLDYSPDTTGATLTPNNTGNLWSNVDSAQNFGEKLIFNTGVTITGMDIYTADYWVQLGQSVTVRTWADLAGTPVSGSVSSFVGTITALDNVGFTTAPALNYGAFTRVFVDFGANSFQLSANTALWIGMSGLGTEIGLLGLTGPNAPDSDNMAQFNGTNYSHMAPIGDMAMRIHGTQGVPDAGSLVTLLGLGLIGIAALRRRFAA